MSRVQSEQAVVERETARMRAWMVEGWSRERLGEGRVAGSVWRGRT